MITQQIPLGVEPQLRNRNKLPEIFGVRDRQEVFQLIYSLFVFTDQSINLG
jgi:hypothetical protein